MNLLELNKKGLENIKIINSAKGTVEPRIHNKNKEISEIKTKKTKSTLSHFKREHLYKISEEEESSNEVSLSINFNLAPKYVQLINF